MSGGVDRAAANARISLFDGHLKRTLSAEQRGVLHSALFDVPRRTSLGWEVLYRTQVPFLRELFQHAGPEEVGRRMRTPGSRPYTLQPFLLCAGYLGAREHHIMDAGLAPGQSWRGDRTEELAFAMEAWERMMAAYRQDGLLLPDQANGALRILDDDVVSDLAARLRPVSHDEHKAIRRLVATLELFTFILHGEQRDGIFGHGPYPLADGGTLFVKEVNDLRNDYLPWALTETRNLVDNVVVAYAARDVTVSCDMLGSMTVEPDELGDSLAGAAVLTNEGGELRAIDAAEAVAIQEAATAAQEELYLRAMEWDDRYKIAYAGPLYANHIKALFDLVDAGDGVRDRIMEACTAVAEELADELMSRPVHPWWGRIAKPGRLYTSVPV